MEGPISEEAEWSGVVTPERRRRTEVRKRTTGISSEMGTELRDWAVWQEGAGRYSQAALSSNDSKTL